MQPESKQMVRNSERMRARQAVRMLPFDHQGRLIPIEPAGILEFGPVDDDVLIGGARGASYHHDDG